VRQEPVATRSPERLLAAQVFCPVGSVFRFARSPLQADNRDVRILITSAAGASDPTRASIPLHIAVNGCVPEGQEVHVVLAGDATELAVGDTVERIEGVGVPPMRELVAKLIEHRVPVYV
jgi:hypothetical protein